MTKLYQARGARLDTWFVCACVTHLVLSYSSSRSLCSNALRSPASSLLLALEVSEVVTVCFMR